MAWTATVARSHFDFREGVVFRDAHALRNGLEAVATSGEAPPAPTASKVAFVYTGQGNQWVGMGEALYESEPVFRAVLDRCDELIREERGVSLLDVMFGRAGAAGDLDEPRWTQPAIYALECALTALWAGVGIRPDVVLGHSLGEIAAAQAAGVFTCGSEPSSCTAGSWRAVSSMSRMPSTSTIRCGRPWLQTMSRDMGLQGVKRT